MATDFYRSGNLKKKKKKHVINMWLNDWGHAIKTKYIH